MSNFDNEINVSVVANTSGFSPAMKSAAADVSNFGHSLVNAKTGFRDIVGEQEAFESAAKSSTTALGGMSVATAGVTREVIVLGREAVSGNFSRIPGSLLVLANRMGGLSLSTVGVGAAIAGVAYGLYEFAKSAENSAEALNHMQLVADLTGKAFDKIQIQGFITQLSQLHDINKATATSIVTDLQGSINVTGETLTKLVNIVPDYAAAIGEKAPEAAKKLAQSLDDPVRLLNQLAETYKGKVTPAQYNAAVAFEAVGNKAAAAGVVADVMQGIFGGSLTKSLTTAQQASTMLGNALSYLGDMLAKPFQLASQFSKSMDDLVIGLYDDEKAVVAATNAQEPYNDQIIKGIQLAKDHVKAISERVKLQNELTQLQASEKAATKIGDTEDAKLFARAIEDVNNQLANFRNSDTTKAAANINEQIQQSKSAFETKAQMMKAEVDLGRLTKEQEIDQLRAATQGEFDIEKELLEKERALYSARSTAWNTENNKILALQSKFTLDMAKIDVEVAQNVKQTNDKALKDWNSYFTKINSAAASSVLGLVSGQRTAMQTVSSIVTAGANTIITQSLRAAEQYIFSERLKTNAVIAGNAIRTSSSSAANSTGLAQQAADATSSIGTSAAEGAAAVYANVAQIPYVGWILAPPAAAAAFVAIEAFGGSIPSAAGGWDVPHDTLAMVHEDEKILPARYSKGLDTMIDNASNNSGGGDVHLHVHAIDAKGVAGFFADNGHHIAKAVKSQIRSNNRGLSVRS